MREILFRGKQTDSDKWIYGVPVKSTAKDESEQLMIEYVFACEEYACRGCEYTPVIPETVGQYTGLTDKNGIKIFEGDMLKGAWSTLIIVYFDESYLQFRAKEFTHRTIDHSIDYYGDNSRLEIVGNIYDNPELLEKRCEKR